MTVDEIKKRVKKIEDMSGDSEAAHYAEDGLHQDVLEAIAKEFIGSGQIADCAAAALETRSIDFDRWYA